MSLERSHLIHYIYLVLGLLVSSILFFLLRYNIFYQFYAAVGGVVYYVLWGLLHHYIEDRVNFHIISEYVLIGGIVILLFALVLGI